MPYSLFNCNQFCFVNVLLNILFDVKIILIKQGIERYRSEYKRLNKMESLLKAYFKNDKSYQSGKRILMKSFEAI
jgi:hypothetical protein